MIQPRYAITALLLSLLSLPATAAVQASLDRDQVSLGDSVQLTIQQDGSRSGTPDLSPLKADFDILGSSQGTSVQFINGHLSQQAQLQITLSPKHGGRLTIPPLQWGNEHTAPLAVSVGGSNSASPSSNPAPAANSTIPDHDASAQDHAFIDTSLSQTQPYVQNAVILTVRVYGDSMLTQAGLNFAASTDVLVQQLGQDVQRRESRAGKDYQVIERRYLLTPQKSGKLTLDGPVLDAQIADLSDDSGFGGPFARVVSTRPVRLHAKPIQLDVRPRPVDSRGHALLPAQSVTLSESWQPDKHDLSTGEPLTRHLHLSAIGVPSNGLPDLSTLLTLPDGIKAYPDQPKLTSQMQGNDLVSSSDLDIALIASSPGHYVLPAVTLSWWDTTENKQRDITLPARTLDVSGAAISAQPPVNQPHGTQASKVTAEPAAPATLPWRSISATLVGLWLLTLLGWLWDHRRLARRRPLHRAAEHSDITAPKPAISLKAVQAACRANDARDARRQLLLWAQATWPDQPLISLQQLAQRLANPELIPLLAELDRACYGNDDTPSHWQGSRLADQLTAPGPDSKKPKTGFGLDELYP